MVDIEPSLESEKITAFIRDSFTNAGFSKAVIGLSGGVDSATSFALAILALGKENVYPVLMPYGPLNSQGVLDAMELVDHFSVPFMHVLRVDIKPAVDTLAHSLGYMDQLRRGNAMVRMRMICLFDQAKKREALVIGTENKTEHLLGYYTRYGDEASDVEPLRHLYKTQVFTLAKYLDVTEKILANPPSAGLWPDQTDEGEFGFSYTDADQILSLSVDGGKSAEEIEKLGHSRDLTQRILVRVKSNQFKTVVPYRLGV